MNLFRSLAVALALSCGLSAMPVMAESSDNAASNDPIYSVQSPPFYKMMGDLLIARPLLIGATVIGTAAFVVSLPFTALGGNVKEAGQALVVDPGKAAFVRCLGCSESGYKQD
ncbi:multidrug transporter [Pseudomonas panipatensis]|jgi:hypothetical protein|uniref:Multidrug transporter n=1 Tax=Pseudomonas panipatensis TaxID=428992 RepID=A0A1G8J5C9_9PSED|nr:multidrug transporter [Pseudomonas panipatensis]SDI26478.1 hypothetical protein SAMN05216272_107165 [Pseudomonas panipatensis]SMP49636.1 hypothetical protein SAMN06295951_102398 [Pseudomonas panipatensis]